MAFCSRRTGSRAALTTLLVLSSAAAQAQAWLPSPGEGAVSVLYQNSRIDRHVFSDGTRVDAGRIDADGLLVDVTYGVNQNVAVSMSLPFMTGRYVGAKPHPGSTIDDGRFHGGVQDFHFDMRYSAVRGALAITPFVGAIMPSHDYTYYGHGAIGRDLRELQVGAYVARLLDPAVPGAFIQAKYTYGVVEQLLNVSHNRSMMDLEIGYFVDPKLRTFGLATGQITHGGIDLTPNYATVLTPAQFLHHDQISRANFLDGGAGAQLSVTPTLDVFGSLVHSFKAINGHAMTYGVTIGASWSFEAAGRKATSEHALVRCLCEKGK